MIDSGDNRFPHRYRFKEDGEVKRFRRGLHRVRRPSRDVDQVPRLRVDNSMPLQVRQWLTHLRPLVLQSRFIGRNKPALLALKLDDDVVALVVMNDRLGACGAPEQRGTNRLAKHIFKRSREPLQSGRERDDVRYDDSIAPFVEAIDQVQELVRTRNGSRDWGRLGRDFRMPFKSCGMRAPSLERCALWISAEQLAAKMRRTPLNVQASLSDGIEKCVSRQRR